MIKVKRIVSGFLRSNCYVVYDSENLHAAIIDPGEDDEELISEIEKNKFKPEILINTHGHYDHIYTDEQIRSKFKIPLALHRDEVSMVCGNSKKLKSTVIVKEPDILLEDNQEIKLSFTIFKVIHTPGHTKGSICLLFDGFLITGDTLFAGTVGRTDLEGGNSEMLPQSLNKLKKLDPSIVIYPGHGNVTTLKSELRNNVWMS
ncbi:MAG: MBL fold metallo-hydrolase [Endomicrobium sp.]|jgi:glyoxylase-like metal-dependent hydrolase (beta-lactamase superfamily II)|nr:MBL fold metallo-hydrolase [Endomicrobium sp.]